MEKTKKRNAATGHKTRQIILKFIVDYIQEHGYSPTVREIAEGTSLKSTSTVHSHLERMLDEGMIE